MSPQRTGSKKPSKPYPDFPLFPHATDRWAKKIRGKLRYFGKVSTDPTGQAALAKWLAEKDYHYSGHPVPETNDDAVRIKDLCNRFLVAKKHLVDSGEIRQRTWEDYFATCQRLAKQFGGSHPIEALTAGDFEKLRASFSKNWAPTTVGNEVNRVRVVFKYGYDSGLLEKPLRFGPHFKRPHLRILRREREKKGLRLFEATDLRRILAAVGAQLRAMTLLGINCGLGNSDCGQLEFRHLDLKTGWLNYPRPKTSVARRAKLWPETVVAIMAAIEKRPAHSDEGDSVLVFITKRGQSWHKNRADNPISNEFRKLLDELKLHRPGLGFYALRYTFETIAGGSKDQVAVNHVMGHSPPSSDMASVYRERIDDDRLVAVAEHVRNWLFPPEEEGEANAAPRKAARTKSGAKRVGRKKTSTKRR